MSRSWLTIGVVCVALVLLALAGVLVVAPSLLPPSVSEQAAAFDDSISPRTLALAIAAFVGLVVAAWSFGSGSSDVDAGLSRPQSSTEPAVPLAGAALTSSVSSIVDELERGRDAATEPVVAELRATLERLETAHGADDQTATARVDAGDWTDDPVAAAFVGGERAPSYSLWRRIYAWLLPARSFAGRVDRTVAAIEARADSLEGGNARRDGAESVPSDGTESAAAAAATSPSGAGGEPDA